MVNVVLLIPLEALVFSIIERCVYDTQKKLHPFLLVLFDVNQESPVQLKVQIKPQVYLWRILRSSMYVLAGTGIRNIISVACGFSSIKVHFSDYPKSLISRINEVYVFFH